MGHFLRTSFLQLLEDVREECGKYGTIHGIAVPKPPATVRMQPGRVYIRFALLYLPHLCMSRHIGRSSPRKCMFVLHLIMADWLQSASIEINTYD